MEENMRHEIVKVNSDVDVRFYLSIDEGSYVTSHWHNSLEIVYMLEGSMIVEIENRKTTILPGEFSLVNSRVIHSITSQKNKALVLQIPNSIFEKYLKNTEILYFDIDIHSDKKDEIIKLNKIKRIFQEMQKIYEKQPDGYLLKFNSLLYDMLFLLIQSFSRKLTLEQMSKTNKYLSRLREITSFLDRNHGEHITLTSLSKEFGYNPDYLSRFFKKYMNITIIDYLYEIRINYIYQDLINTDLYISEIFDRHGCSNYKFAIKLFKERYGTTPKEKRKELHNELLKKSE